MDFELRAAREKLEREQRERKEKARAKLERERKAREEALRQKEAVEAEQRLRRLEAAEAAEAARQEDEEDRVAGNGIRFSVRLQALPYDGFGDKIKLPPSSFDQLSGQGALDKGPMYFELSVNIDGEQRKTHSGVLEFTSHEGFVELPPQVWQNLMIPAKSENPEIRIRYVRLPKGTYAKLEPKGVGFADIPNHRAVLETTLRQYATLSEGGLLVVHHGGMSYGLKVLQLRPASSISVLDTDIQVDIIDPTTMLIPLVLGKSETGVVEEGKYNYYKFLIDAKIVDAVINGDLNVVVKLEVRDGDGDADLYISRHPLLFPNQHRHQWSSHDVGTKIVPLTGKGQSLDADTYSIAVFGFKGVSKYKILVECEPSSQHQHGRKLGIPTQSISGVDSEQCQNCKQFIPATTIALHEAYCRRHNIVCSHKGCGIILRKEEAAKHVHCLKCGQAFQQQEMEKHMKVFHEPLHCPCGAVLEKEEMVGHQSSACPMRLITCRFCGDMVQAGNATDDARDRLCGLSQHESLCGSRTAPCDSCGRVVMLKEMDLHRVAVHEKPAPGTLFDDSTVSRSSTSLLGNFPAPTTSAFQAQTSPPNQDQIVENLECPICEWIFSGSDAGGQLNAHLDKDHFSSMESSLTSGDSSEWQGTNSLRTMLVSCPICGINVHSERDLSRHIDMVH